MPVPTDPANARLALRRLIRNLVLASTTGTRDPGNLDTFDGVLSHLDSDELADYDTVSAALDGVEPPRFGTLDWNGFALLDLAEVRDPHGTGRAEVMIAGSEPMVAALATILNRDPDEFDTVWKDLNTAEPEPF